MPLDPSHAAEITERLATIYRDGEHTDPDPRALALLREHTDRWFARIPLPVEWCDGEPYSSFDAMCSDIRAGRFRMCDYDATGYRSPIFGACYKHFRAVHDWFGHYCGGHGFGVMGELGAFGVHAGMFPVECWPLVWNETILANAYRDHFKTPAPDKLVLMRATPCLTCVDFDTAPER